MVSINICEEKLDIGGNKNVTEPKDALWKGDKYMFGRFIFEERQMGPSDKSNKQWKSKTHSAGRADARGKPYTLI